MTATVLLTALPITLAADARAHLTAFFWLGKLIEAGPTDRIFTAPREKLTEDYVTGRFG